MSRIINRGLAPAHAPFWPCVDGQAFTGRFAAQARRIDGGWGSGSDSEARTPCCTSPTSAVTCCPPPLRGLSLLARSISNRPPSASTDDNRCCGSMQRSNRMHSGPPVSDWKMHYATPCHLPYGLGIAFLVPLHGYFGAACLQWWDTLHAPFISIGVRVSAAASTITNLLFW